MALLTSVKQFFFFFLQHAQKSSRFPVCSANYRSLFWVFGIYRQLPEKWSHKKRGSSGEFSCWVCLSLGRVRCHFRFSLSLSHKVVPNFPFLVSHNPHTHSLIFPFSIFFSGFGNTSLLAAFSTEILKHCERVPHFPITNLEIPAHPTQLAPGLCPHFVRFKSPVTSSLQIYTDIRHSRHFSKVRANPLITHPLLRIYPRNL